MDKQSRVSQNNGPVYAPRMVEALHVRMEGYRGAPVSNVSICEVWHRT